jgi:hypothetical protein
MLMTDIVSYHLSEKSFHVVEGSLPRAKNPKNSLVLIISSLALLSFMHSYWP